MVVNWESEVLVFFVLRVQSSSCVIHERFISSAWLALLYELFIDNLVAVHLVAWFMFSPQDSDTSEVNLVPSPSET